MSNKLKPCPNCGKLDAKCEPSHYVNHFAFSVFCVCGTGSKYAQTVEKAIEIWNYRPIEDKLQSEIDKLNKALDLACEIVSNGCPESYKECKYPDESLSKANEVGCVQCWKEYYLKEAGE